MTYFPNHKDTLEIWVPLEWGITGIIASEYVDITAGIASFEHSISDIVQTRNYMGDSGKTRSQVTGQQERFSFVSDNEPDDDTVAKLAEILRYLEHNFDERGDSKFRWTRGDIVAGSALVYGDITIENIVLGGGESTNLSIANFEFNANQNPTVEVVA